jgi:hypothetical protein
VVRAHNRQFDLMGFGFTACRRRSIGESFEQWLAIQIGLANHECKKMRSFSNCFVCRQFRVTERASKSQKPDHEWGACATYCRQRSRNAKSA